MRILNKTLFAALTATALSLSINVAKAADISALEAAAKQEGEVNSLGMPDSWANWKDTWEDLNKKYGLKHVDTDMSSAQEIAKFDAEKKNATADIGDVGASFGPIAKKKGVTLAYKTSYWDDVPAWAKDDEGHWMLAYTGTIAFIVNKETVKDIPRSWADLLKGTYKVTVGDVSAAAQAVNGILAANFALGGDEKDLTPALEFFAKLAKQGRVGNVDPSITNLEKGEVDMAILWDFNGLNYRDKIDPKRFEVLIPSDGSVMSGYSTIINKYAKHPNAAKLAREYIFSDEGQINLARGYARPIRAEKIKLPEDVVSKLLPAEQYKSARPIKDPVAWEKTSKKLPRQWQEQVIMNMK
ncbi:ABC transporter substrate-binding protein [Pelistega europaea]|uniref:Solute-binding protein n=1 Tax=Pelistega europaea TaxID=106147 RepID=A0A7Y4L7Z3_9BURK|nr:ABC transporter substrate-binding protein [Pelistega europaea]NOL48624.1 solute-binding protein [Pelistega europaea]